MKCPFDGKPLAKEVYEGDVEIDVCAACGGSWLDCGELERIQETIEHDYRAEMKRVPPLVEHVAAAYRVGRETGGGRIGCPACAVDLVRKEYGYCSQIMIDICPKCRGIWLQRGELQALELFFERARVETPKMKRSFLATLKEFLTNELSR